MRSYMVAVIMAFAAGLLLLCAAYVGMTAEDGVAAGPTPVLSRPVARWEPPGGRRPRVPLADSTAPPVADRDAGPPTPG